jgi:hypothetical protein
MLTYTPQHPWSKKLDETKARQIVVLRDMNIPVPVIAQHFGMSPLSIRLVANLTNSKGTWRAIGQERAEVTADEFAKLHSDPTTFSAIMKALSKRDEELNAKHKAMMEIPRRDAKSGSGVFTVNVCKLHVAWLDPNVPTIEGQFDPPQHAPKNTAGWYWARVPRNIYWSHLPIQWRGPFVTAKEANQAATSLHFDAPPPITFTNNPRRPFPNDLAAEEMDRLPSVINEIKEEMLKDKIREVIVINKSRADRGIEPLPEPTLLDIDPLA